MDHQTLTLPPDLEKQVRRTLDEWRAGGKVRRLWARDATLWTGADESRWLDWLEIACDQLAHPYPFRRLSEAVRLAGFTPASVPSVGGSRRYTQGLAMPVGKID